MVDVEDVPCRLRPHQNRRGGRLLVIDVPRRAEQRGLELRLLGAGGGVGDGRVDNGAHAVRVELAEGVFDRRLTARDQGKPHADVEDVPHRLNAYITLSNTGTFFRVDFLPG